MAKKHPGWNDLSWGARIVALPVWTYRLLISPWLPPSCRYSPSCSEYALEALKLHGPFKGFVLAARRIGRCHPWGGHGYDPVPGSEGNVTCGCSSHAHEHHHHEHRSQGTPL